MDTEILRYCVRPFPYDDGVLFLMMICLVTVFGVHHLERFHCLLVAVGYKCFINSAENISFVVLAVPG